MPIVQTTDEDGNELEFEVGTDDLDLKEDEDPTDLPGVQDEIDRIAGKTRTKTRKKTKKQLRDDDEHFRELAERRGIELREDGSPKGASKGEVKELKKELAQAKERAQRADELEDEVAEIRDTRLENTLLQETDAVKSDLEDIFLDVAKDRFEYDEADDAFYPVEDEEIVYSKGPGDVVDEILDERPSLARDTQASGGPDTDPGETGTTNGKRTWTEEEHDNADPVGMSDELFEDWKTAQEEGRVK